MFVFMNGKGEKKTAKCRKNFEKKKTVLCPYRSVPKGCSINFGDLKVNF
jgi:hypothetical protein